MKAIFDSSVEEEGVVSNSMFRARMLSSICARSNLDRSVELVLLGARKRYLPSYSSFELSTDILSLQAKERGAASAGASSVMIKSNFTRSKFVVLSSYHSKSPAFSPLLCIKYREVPENLNNEYVQICILHLCITLSLKNHTIRYFTYRHTSTMTKHHFAYD
jgi:hypothetical protein